MSTTLKRRLAKIENVLKPKPVQQVAVFVEPGQEATAEERRKYESDLEQAERAGFRVFVVRLVSPPVRPIEEDGRTIFGSEHEALIAALASRTSGNGNGSALDDALQMLSGNVIRPGPG